MIDFRCPNGHRLQVTEDKAGKLARCPSCGQTARAPFPSPGSRPPPAPGPGSRASGSPREQVPGAGPPAEPVRPRLNPPRSTPPSPPPQPERTTGAGRDFPCPPPLPPGPAGRARRLLVIVSAVLLLGSLGWTALAYGLYPEKPVVSVKQFFFNDGTVRTETEIKAPGLWRFIAPWIATGLSLVLAGGVFWTWTKQRALASPGYRRGPRLALGLLLAAGVGAALVFLPMAKAQKVERRTMLHVRLDMLWHDCQDFVDGYGRYPGEAELERLPEHRHYQADPRTGARLEYHLADLPVRGTRDREAVPVASFTPDADGVRAVLFTDGRIDFLAEAPYSQAMEALRAARERDRARPDELTTRSLLRAGFVDTFCWSADGTRVATVAPPDMGATTAAPGEVEWTAEVVVWEVEPAAEVGRLKAVARAIALSPDGKRLATGGRSGRVELWDVRSGGRLSSLDAHAKGVTGIAFCPGGDRLASAGGDGTVKVWAAGKVVWSSPGSKDGKDALVFRSVRFSPDGQYLAALGGPPEHLPDQGEPGPPGAPGPGGPMPGGLGGGPMAPGTVPPGLGGSVRGPNTVKVWRTDSGQPVFAWEGNERSFTGLVFSPDSRKLAASGRTEGPGGAAGPRTQVWVWEMPGDRPVTVIEQAELPMSIAFRPDGRRLMGLVDERHFGAGAGMGAGGGMAEATAPGMGAAGSVMVRLWDLQTGKPVRSLSLLGPAEVRGTEGSPLPAFSPDGRRLAVHTHRGIRISRLPDSE